MHEKELLTMQNKIREIVKQSPADQAAAVEKLLELKKEAENLLTLDSPEYNNAAATIYEAIGDIQIRAKKPVEAEKSYKEMLQYSNKVYLSDKEKYDYRQAVSCYKIANFYRTGLQCNMLNPKPKQLNDIQKKVFNLAEAFYKNTMVCITQKAKKGVPQYVEMHSSVMSDLAVMYACIGNYQKAADVGKNGIQVDKAIYDRHDDKVHGLRLAVRMNTLAVIYSYMKNIAQSAETIEDANFVLERHVNEEPIAAGILLGRNYLNLGGCYRQMEEEKENAEETLLAGLNKILEVNEKTNGKMKQDVIFAYMRVGDYYKKVGNEEKAQEYFRLAKEK